MEAHLSASVMNGSRLSNYSWCVSYHFLCYWGGLNITIATFVDVEQVFSHGRILLSHIRNRLAAQTTCALMCVGTWSQLGFVKDSDVLAVSLLADVEGEEEEELEEGWDAIKQ
jgi:hypothetical protein